MRFETELGEAVLDQAAVFGMPVVRVRRVDVAACRRGRQGRARLRLPLVHRRHRLDAGAEGGWRRRRQRHVGAGAAARRPPTAPPAPTVASRCSPACSRPAATGASPSRPTSTRSRSSCSRGCRSTPGADWHERECWEMYGFVFDGHPALRHLYLPSEFEGHPLRKDFPLLARVVKPWPGLVDVEPMPGEGDDADADADAEADGRPPREHHRTRRCPSSTSTRRVPPPRRRAGGRRARHRRHDPQPRPAAPGHPRHAAPRGAPRRRARASRPTRSSATCTAATRSSPSSAPTRRSPR